MSGGRLRKEKVCLNCNARVFGPYCYVCGQHNIEPKETAWGLVVHFFNDITHFEGKFITSLRYLLLKPGFLTAEYERGRRASYMNPVRMYVFTSAIFFIIFFSVFKVKDEAFSINYAKLEQQFEEMNANFNIDFVTGNIHVEGVKVGNISNIDAFDKKLVDSLVRSAVPQKKKNNSADSAGAKEQDVFFDLNKGFSSKEQYDSVQHSLPPAKKDNWVQKKIVHKSIAIKQKYGNNKGLVMAKLSDIFLHQMPTIFFVSLPFFAFILYLLYIRRRRRFYFVNHAVFSIYYYIFVFVNLLFYFAANKLEGITHWRIFTWVQTLLILTTFFYLYKAMRNYYRQGRAKTIFKFLILNFVFLIITVLLFAGFLIFSVFNI
jgi:hypothetical protein